MPANRFDTPSWRSTEIEIARLAKVVLMMPAAIIPAIGYGGWTQATDANTATSIAVGADTQMILRSDGMVWAKKSIGYGGWTQETDANTAVSMAVG